MQWFRKFLGLDKPIEVTVTIVGLAEQVKRYEYRGRLLEEWHREYRIQMEEMQKGNLPANLKGDMDHKLATETAKELNIPLWDKMKV